MKPMNYITVLIVVTALAAAVPASAADPAGSPLAGATVNRIEATINSKPVTTRDLFIYSKSRPQTLSITRQELLDEVIARELLYQEALASGLDKVPEIALEIENQRRSTLATAVTSRLLKSKPVEEDEIRQVYKNASANPIYEFKLREILVDTEKQANEIINQLNQGANFISLAREKTRPSARQSGGDLGWYNQTLNIEPYNRVTASLLKGAYTRNPVHSPAGWHIILMEDQRKIELPPYEQAREKIRMSLENEAIASHINELKKNARIEINPGR